MTSSEPPRIEVRRSRRRTRSVTAYRDGDTVVVLMPAHLTRAQERAYVDELVARLDRRERRRRPDDQALVARAAVLARRYLPEPLPAFHVRWVTNQRSRWGSCTPSDRTIRLSHRLQAMPQYVIDHVLLHELAHLLVPDHSPRFHALIAGYPHASKAEGFLAGWAAAQHQAHAPEPGDVAPMDATLEADLDASLDVD